jgi:hypothetical protein
MRGTFFNNRIERKQHHMQHHLNYSKFPEGEEPVTRTFRMAKADWQLLLNMRDELLASHGIKLSMNATLIHLLHLHHKANQKVQRT